MSGTIVNGANNEPLPSASIFINNSSRGTVSNANGKFLLEGIPLNSFDLVISYTGFITQSVKIGPDNISHPLVVRMIPRTESLESITIMVPEKDGWKTWGKFFTETFLGMSDFAKECRIENPRDVKFFHDRKHNQLKAHSVDNLVIRNNALGYTVTYLLEDFTYDFKNKITSFSGYAFFTEMKTRRRKKRERWQKARKEAYDGSLMYFMRALYKDSVAAYGFDVREKIRVNDDDSLFSKIYKPGNFPTVQMRNDTYKVVPGPDVPFKNRASYVYLVNTKTLSFKDALYIDSATSQRSFYFNNMLQVIYKNGFAKGDYLVAHGYPKQFKMNQISDISLVQNEPLVIQPDGTYFNPMNLISSGYWGWAHMGEMLPTDYE